MSSLISMPVATGYGGGVLFSMNTSECWYCISYSLLRSDRSSKSIFKIAVLSGTLSNPFTIAWSNTWQVGHQSA